MNDHVDPPGFPAPSSEAERADLLRLCQRHGIGAEYYDIWGHRRVVPEHGLRALLRAMGVEAGDSAQVRASLRAAGERRRRLSSSAAPCPRWRCFGRTRHPGSCRCRRPRAPERCAGNWSRRPAPSTAVFVEDFHIELPDNLPSAITGCTGCTSTLTRRRAPAFLDADCRGAQALLPAPAAPAGPPGLGAGGATVCTALRAQLGHRRLHRSGRRGAHQCGQMGAALVGLNPLHALYPHNPEHASPYAPSSRRFLQCLYIDVEAVAEFALCSEARYRVRPRFPGSPARAAPARSGRLSRRGRGQDAGARTLYASFPRRAHLARAGGASRLRRGHANFARFRPAADGAAPARLVRGPAGALFPARCHGLGLAPVALRVSRSGVGEVAEFLREHLERVEFYEYLQWQAELQLAEAGRAAWTCAPGRWSVPGPGRVGRPRRRRVLGGAGLVRAQRQRRLPAG
jgi:(1->4)-alpha-D-glucan 1-alpha-D-glucosylmutase